LAELDLRGVLEALADPGDSPAGGSAAALVGAIAAATAAKGARASGDHGSAAQAAALAAKLTQLAAVDAEALRSARGALADASAGGDDRRDFGLGQALAHAAAVPLDVAEACADVAALAAGLADSVVPDLRPDCRTASWLAAAGARAAAHLVEINLAVQTGDDRAERARRAAAMATDAAS
jgi:formiminotetrahydrofolate cyclodeaminase